MLGAGHTIHGLQEKMADLASPVATALHCLLQALESSSHLIIIASEVCVGVQDCSLGCFLFAQSLSRIIS